MRKRAEEVLETPITPMIDVVFQLIIFFVVASAQQKDIIDENVTLAQASRVPAIEKNEPRAITINVHQDGDLNIAMQPLTLKQLYQVLNATRSQSGDSVPIVLRCDAKTQYKEVDRIVEVVGKAGLYRVRLAAVSTLE